MQAGDLDERIDILAPTRATANAYGERITAFAVLFEAVPAKVMRPTGRQFFKGDQIQTQARAAFQIRYRADITRNMRVSYDSRQWDIIDVTPFNNSRRQFVEITTVEALGEDTPQ